MADLTALVIAAVVPFELDVDSSHLLTNQSWTHDKKHRLYTK